MVGPELADIKRHAFVGIGHRLPSGMLLLQDGKVFSGQRANHVAATAELDAEIIGINPQPTSLEPDKSGMHSTHDGPNPLFVSELLPAFFA